MINTSKTRPTPKSDTIFSGINSDDRDSRIMAALHLAKELESNCDELAEALRKLSNEINAALYLGEDALREVIGNTNLSVLKLRLGEATSALLVRIDRERK